MTESKPLTVPCPGCGNSQVWSRENPHRPFCSERCRNRDFIAWANQEQVINGDNSYDDLLSEDLPPR
jgi:endogenous inhibitor of DNA gyrase (YacG/DUF329 family)